MNSVEKSVFIFVSTLCLLAGLLHAFDVYMDFKTEAKYLECVQKTHRRELCQPASLRYDRRVQ